MPLRCGIWGRTERDWEAGRAGHAGHLTGCEGQLWREHWLNGSDVGRPEEQSPEQGWCRGCSRDWCRDCNPDSCWVGECGSGLACGREEQQEEELYHTGWRGPAGWGWSHGCSPGCAGSCCACLPAWRRPTPWLEGSGRSCRAPAACLGSWSDCRAGTGRQLWLGCAPYCPPLRYWPRPRCPSSVSLYEHDLVRRRTLGGGQLQC